MTKEELIELIKKSELNEEDISEISSIIDSDFADLHAIELFNKRIEMVFNKINETINSEGVKHILEQIKNFASQKEDAALKKIQEQHTNFINARQYLTKKYWQDILMVVILCAVIILLNTNGKMNETATGTLLGTIIGYALSRFKSKTNEN